MKLRLYTGIITLAIFISATYVACIKDTCASTICYNGGVCVQARCTCPAGYEGVSCGERWYEKFYGEWNADDTYARDTTATHVGYTLQVLAGSADSFIVNGLADTINNIVCHRSDTYVFTISQQVVDSFVTVNGGKASISNGVITGIYSLQYRADIAVDTGIRKLDTTITIRTTWVR